MFIKKIFDGRFENDNLVHLQFQKFSRGEFKNKAIVVAKLQSKGVYSISTTAEYANELVKFLAEKLGDNKSKVTGVIISTRDLGDLLDHQNKKQFMGIKQYIIDKEMTGNEILELCEKLPNSFLGLSFKVNDSELKIKPKSPKSAKPSNKGDNIKTDFCKLKTNDTLLVNELIFDKEVNDLNFKTVEIKHEFIINEIVITDKMKKEVGEDYGKLREMAIRKGKVVRKIKVDGREFIKEKEFEV